MHFKCDKYLHPGTESALKWWNSWDINYSYLYFSKALQPIKCVRKLFVTVGWGICYLAMAATF